MAVCIILFREDERSDWSIACTGGGSTRTHKGPFHRTRKDAEECLEGMRSGVSELGREYEWGIREAWESR